VDRNRQAVLFVTDESAALGPRLSGMRILIDLTHPGDVHFFRYAIPLWRERGHTILITARRKDLTVDLLQRLNIEHEDLGAARSGLLGLSLELFARTYRLCRRVREFRPDVMTTTAGTFIAQASWICGVPSVVFYDTENATLSNLITYPVCTAVVTPRCYTGRVPAAKHHTYPGYQELAYTHPRRFTPDPARLAEFGLSRDEPFIFLRMVSWGAAHDTLDHGFTHPERAVRELERFGRVVISAEGRLPPALEPNRLSGPLENVHHVLAFARLYIGESATMASESATLGTPSIFVATTGRGYTDEQERRYGLTYTFRDRRTAQQDGLAKAVEILSDPDAKNRWAAKRDQMLADTIDVTEYVVELVESYGRR
jgi:predicted glycosyltransferase